MTEKSERLSSFAKSTLSTSYSVTPQESCNSFPPPALDSLVTRHMDKALEDALDVYICLRSWRQKYAIQNRSTPSAGSYPPNDSSIRRASVNTSYTVEDAPYEITTHQTSFQTHMIQGTPSSQTPRELFQRRPIPLLPNHVPSSIATAQDRKRVSFIYLIRLEASGCSRPL